MIFTGANMKTTITVASTIVLSSMLVAACGGSSSDQPPPQTQQQAMYGQPAQPGQPVYGQPAQPGQPVYGQPAPAAAPAAAPAHAAAPAAAPAPAANPAADQAMAAGIAALLKPRAAKEAKGMKEDGAPIAGMLSDGGTVDRDMNLMPGKCYTILGTGLPPVTQVNMKISLKIALPMLPPGVLAQSSTTGLNAAIGAGKDCYKTIGPVAIPVVLSISGTGAGAVGAQVYIK
jgi:predicted small secreted protein